MSETTYRKGVPVVPITDKAFKYTNSNETDIRKTFARARKEQRVAEPVTEKDTPSRVVPLPRRVK